MRPAFSSISTWRAKSAGFYRWLAPLLWNVFLLIKAAHSNKYNFIHFVFSSFCAALGINFYTMAHTRLAGFSYLLIANTLFFFGLNIVFLSLLAALLERRYQPDESRWRKLPYAPNDFRWFAIRSSRIHYLQLAVLIAWAAGYGTPRLYLTLFFLSFAGVTLVVLMCVAGLIKLHPSEMRPANYDYTPPADPWVLREVSVAPAETPHKKRIAGEVRNCLPFTTGAKKISLNSDRASQMEIAVGIEDSYDPKTLSGDVKISVNGRPSIEKPLRLLGSGWNDFQIPLDPGSSSVTLDIESRSAAPFSVSIPHFSKKTGPENQRNIILIIVDSLRQDEVGLYGCQEGTTPFIDRAFRDYTRYQDSYIQGEWTLPTFVSMTTSLYPSHHHVLHHDYNACKLPPLDQEMLAEAMRRQGYLTYAYVSSTRASQMFGLDRGFERFSLSETGASDQEIVAKTIELLHLHPDENKFILLHVFGMHGGPFQLGSAFSWKGAERMTVSPDEIVQNNAKKKPPLDQDPYLRTIRKNKLRELDSSLSPLFALVEQDPNLRNTALILTSDHGTDLPGDGISNWYRKHLSKHRLNHPLLMRCPWRPETHNRIINGYVEGSVDMYPTIADLAEVNVKNSPYSRSFLPDRQGKYTAKDYVVTEMIFRGYCVCRIEGWGTEYIYEFNWYKNTPVEEKLKNLSTGQEISSVAPEYSEKVKKFREIRSSLKLFSKESDVNMYY